MKSIGIHQVPVAQKKIVKPLRKGSSVSRNHASGAFSIKSEPASVEMAIAPMLIQYGGERSAGVNCSPSLDRPAGLFPAGSGQGGPYAILRMKSRSKIAAIFLCGRAAGHDAGSHHRRHDALSHWRLNRLG